MKKKETEQLRKIINSVLSGNVRCKVELYHVDGSSIFHMGVITEIRFDVDNYYKAIHVQFDKGLQRTTTEYQPASFGMDPYDVTVEVTNPYTEDWVMPQNWWEEGVLWADLGYIQPTVWQPLPPIPYNKPI